MNADQTNDEITKIRKVLFPAIGIQIITGFNLYGPNEQLPAVSRDDKIVRISYLHEDLVQNAPHYEQIKRMLEKYCDQTRVQKLEHEVISRFSSYLLEEQWRTKQYFLIDQTPVKEKDVDELVRQNITVIGCGSQNELVIQCEINDIAAILEQFRLCANKYEIDVDTGEYVLSLGTDQRTLNLHKTWNEPWEVPCIFVHARTIDKIKTYARVKEVSFALPQGIASLVIGKKWDTACDTKTPVSLLIPSFEQYLESLNFAPVKVNNAYFANRIFFNWINEVNWKRVAKTLEMYGHIFTDHFKDRS